MKRFIEGADRTQVSLLPDCVDDYVGTDNPVRVIEAFVEQLDLREIGFESVDPEATGRPAYHPSNLHLCAAQWVPIPTAGKPLHRRRSNGRLPVCHVGRERPRLWHRCNQRCANAAAGVPGCQRRECPHVNDPDTEVQRNAAARGRYTHCRLKSGVSTRPRSIPTAWVCSLLILYRPDLPGSHSAVSARLSVTQIFVSIVRK